MPPPADAPTSPEEQDVSRAWPQRGERGDGFDEVGVNTHRQQHGAAADARHQVGDAHEDSAHQGLRYREVKARGFVVGGF